MELNITNLFYALVYEDKACQLSASVLEMGNNAGAITWNNSKEEAKNCNLLDTEEKKEAFREFVESSGGWTMDKIMRWDDIELEALFIQWIAGDIREGGLDELIEGDEEHNGAVWKEYEERCEQGQCSSNIFGGPMSEDGSIYFCLG